MRHPDSIILCEMMYIVKRLIYYNNTSNKSRNIVLIFINLKLLFSKT